MADPIRFYFDFSSPYAWFALDRLEHLARMHQREIVWRPVLLWAVFKAQGIPVPLEAPAKRAYLIADMERSAAFYGVPFRLPDVLGVSTHLAARLFYAMTQDRPHIAPALARTLLRAHLAENRPLTEEAVLLACAAAFGWGPEEARAALQAAACKQQLVAAVDEAVALGVIGSPFFVVDGEGFFGVDRLPHVAWRLAGSGQGGQNDR
ncbi:2-hydroxychromene-2-carboxylate isomerase [Aquabacter sp. L1I39]|uniref:2-hydroxychromene-2-carboxylate isomerase n=1 Tax=Aquabacter sp. L1I39 TaxID=2820278 RepID=UPI001ADAC4FC|nr:2-hydroxychromene-2-carboxylate isomerase [Aquabacter sp. L1I39]QTL04018.1 2-hydroxychromene-2-carboxylate isomerase [Aquabacter sp. L1I39]